MESKGIHEQEKGYEKRLSELALPEDESQIPVRERLDKLLLHSDSTWDDVESNIQHLMDSDTSPESSPTSMTRQNKFKKRKKKSKKRVHGRMTYTVDQPPSRVTTHPRSITSCPGRRHSRPVGSCWAGKGACLQDFYSNSPKSRGMGSR